MRQIDVVGGAATSFRLAQQAPALFRGAAGERSRCLRLRDHRNQATQPARDFDQLSHIDFPARTAAMKMNVDPALVAMATAMGKQTAHMIQPFRWLAYFG